MSVWVPCCMVCRITVPCQCGYHVARCVGSLCHVSVGTMLLHDVWDQCGYHVVAQCVVSVWVPCCCTVCSVSVGTMLLHGV